MENGMLCYSNFQFGFQNNKTSVYNLYIMNNLITNNNRFLYYKMGTQV